MTPEQILIECAKLDGWEFIPEHDVNFKTPAGNVYPAVWRKEFDNRIREVTESKHLPPYTTSHDAILPLIGKLLKNNGKLEEAFWTELNKDTDFFEEHGHIGMLYLTPLQLATVLLKAC